MMIGHAHRPNDYRFQREQSREMRSASWDSRIRPPIRSLRMFWIRTIRSRAWFWIAVAASVVTYALMILAIGGK